MIVQNTYKTVQKIVTTYKKLDEEFQKTYLESYHKNTYRYGFRRQYY